MSAGRQALLALAHLRGGHAYARLAAGFGVGTTTAYRYIVEAGQGAEPLFGFRAGTYARQVRVAVPPRFHDP